MANQFQYPTKVFLKTDPSSQNCFSPHFLTVGYFQFLCLEDQCRANQGFLTKVCREDKKQLFGIYLAFSRSNLSTSCEIQQGSESRRIKSSEDETVWAILSNSLHQASLNNENQSFRFREKFSHNLVVNSLPKTKCRFAISQ